MSNHIHKSVKGKYLCNKSEINKDSKVSDDWNKITCKNCLLFRKAFEVKI